MNTHYQTLLRTGVSELTIADYQRQQLAVIYFVEFPFISYISGAALNDPEVVLRVGFSFFVYYSSSIWMYWISFLFM